MGGTILGRCEDCNVQIDVDPLTDPEEPKLCDDCEEERRSSGSS